MMRRTRPATTVAIQVNRATALIAITSPDVREVTVAAWTSPGGITCINGTDSGSV
jgi:hypothetical protein